MRSNISIEEEEQEQIKKQNQLSHELNKTAISLKELENEFNEIIDKKNIETISLETQEKIIEISNIMYQLIEGQKTVISALIHNDNIDKNKEK